MSHYAAPKDLLLAIANYHVRLAERDKARDDCDESWDYFGAKYDTKLEKAERDLAEIVDSYIDSRIAAALERNR